MYINIDLKKNKTSSIIYLIYINDDFKKIVIYTMHFYSNDK